MGNYCCLERPRRGGGGGAVHYARTTNPVWVEEARKGKGKGEGGGGHAPAAATTEVKIRITRRQLEELLRRVEGGKHAGAGGGAPVHEVISELLRVVSVSATSSSHFRHRAEAQWRPSLQTIPESE